MFFRRKAKPAVPIKGEDGHYYVDEEGEYDSDEWETDSDYSSENESDEENKQDVEGDDGSEVKISDAAAETEEEKDVASEQDEAVNDDGEENTNEIVVNEYTQDDSEETTPDTKEAENIESVLDSTNGHALDLEEVNLSTDSTGMVSVNIDEETTEDQFEGSKKKVEESPTQDESNNEENNLTMTLEEKRSLVALAAEHDRVDILKTILQPHPAQRTNDSNPIFLAQLLLNNIIVKDPSNSYTEEDLEKVFIPPLHVAIASSATNAATCLLRMGSDPSIRPNIPESDEWEGPSWQDENGELYAERGGIGAATSWKLFHGVSAWELAFGTLQIPTSNEKDDVKSKSKWFGFRSKTSTNDQEEVEEKKLYIPIEIEENKLEGIKHAFTAEALRAIGSDEVTRLSELINSGLGTTSRIEIGGKDLFAWCQEMNAQNCIAMLESMNASTDPEAEYYEANENSDSESYEEVEAEDETPIVEEETAKIESTMGGSDDESTTEYDEARLEEMTNKLEESDALSSALSTMLDHIAEEVAITEGLIMQQGDSSNTTLLSQVRVLKTKRAEVEDELPRQQRILEDRYAELDMVKIWWKKQGGSLREIPTRMEEYKKEKEEGAKKAKMTGNFKEDVQKVTQKLEESEKKVRKIRSSIAELSQVSVKNLKEVEKLGLLGAVNLTRKLKDEVRVRKDSLEAIRKEEKSVQDQVTLIRTLIEEKQVVKKTENQIPEVVDDLEAERVEQIIDSIRPESPVLKTENIGRRVSDGEEDSDSFESVEGDHDESSSSDEDDSYSGSDSDSYDSNDKALTHSQAIQAGQSAEIVQWVDDEDLGIFTFKVWNLLQRIFGLSKKAIKETAKSTVEEVGNLPRVLII